MAKFNGRSVASYALIVLIAMLSFRAFAGFLTPNFDADQAVHVLMAADLRLPEDLYYWGQNRLGSLLPILSHWLLTVVPLTPIQAVSYTQYLFLGVGFLCYASLLRQPSSRAIFALVWFLPAVPFQKLVEVAHPYAPQFALLGIALVAGQRLSETTDASMVSKLLWSSILIFSLTLSIWVSDLSVVAAAIALVCASRNLAERVQKRHPLNLSEQILTFFRLNVVHWYAAFLMVLGGAFLAYAKSSASQRDENYGLFAMNSLKTIVQITSTMLSAIRRTLLFQVHNPALSLYGIASLVALVALIHCARQAYPTLLQTSAAAATVRWLPVLLSSAAGMLLLILLSRWTLIQSTPARYFIGIYLCGWLAALLFVEHLDIHLLLRHQCHRGAFRLKTLLILTALLGSLSLPHFVLAIEKPPARLSQLQPLAALGEAGFIGNYWSSYLLCVTAPERLSCTPHDQDFARCPRCIEQVLKSSVIYLVSQDWLAAFPDEIGQFGQRLQKQQPAQHIAGYWMAPYRRRHHRIHEIKHQPDSQRFRVGM